MIRANQVQNDLEHCSRTLFSLKKIADSNSGLRLNNFPLEMGDLKNVPPG